MTLILLRILIAYIPIFVCVPGALHAQGLNEVIAIPLSARQLHWKLFHFVSDTCWLIKFKLVLRLILSLLTGGSIYGQEEATDTGKCRQVPAAHSIGLRLRLN